jgi:hypothetical protein
VLSVASLETHEGNAGIAHIQSSQSQAGDIQTVENASKFEVNAYKLNSFMSIDDRAFLAAAKPSGSNL